MQEALALARQAALAGEVPVGAVVVHDPSGRVLGRARNEVEALRDPTAHAEMLALERARDALGERHLTECTLWVTLEPCALCAAAIALHRVRRVVFGAYDPKGGAVEHGPRLFGQPTVLHRPEIVGGMCETESAALLRRFFAGLRDG